MIATLELHDDVASGEAASQADRAHRRFGTGTHEAHQFDGRHEFDHAPGNDNAQNRARGFESRSAELGLTVVPRKLLKLSLEEGRRTMEDTLVSTPDIAGVFFMNQVVAQGAYAALEGAKRTDVKLVPFDIDAVSFQMVKDGKLLGIIIQDPYKMGYEGVKAAVDHIRGKDVKPLIDTGVHLITLDNLDSQERLVEQV